MGREARINAAKRAAGLFSGRTKTGVPLRPVAETEATPKRKRAATKRAAKTAAVVGALAAAL